MAQAKSFLQQLKQLARIRDGQTDRIRRRESRKGLRGSEYHKEAEMDLFDGVNNNVDLFGSDNSKIPSLMVRDYNDCIRRGGNSGNCVEKVYGWASKNGIYNLPKESDVRLDPTFYSDDAKKMVRDYARGLLFGKYSCNETTRGEK